MRVFHVHWDRLLIPVVVAGFFVGLYYLGTVTFEPIFGMPLSETKVPTGAAMIAGFMSFVGLAFGVAALVGIAYLMRWIFTSEDGD